MSNAREKEFESFNFKEIEDNSKLTKGNSKHPVIPGREELSKRLLEGKS